MNGLSFIRRRCNLSQGQLAQMLGVTRQAIKTCGKTAGNLCRRHAYGN